MRKLAILFLLTIVLASSAFAIEGVGNFTVGATAEFVDVADALAKQGIGITPVVTFSRDIIPGLNLFIGLNSDVGIWDDDRTFSIPFASGSKTSVNLNKIEEKISYGLEAGPGTLSFFLRNRNNIHVEPSADAEGAIRIGVGYGGIAAGPGTISFGAYTGFGYMPGDLNYNDLGVEVAYALEAGLSIYVTPWFDIGKTAGVSKDFKLGGIYFNVGYGQEAWAAGVEGGIDYASVHGNASPKFGINFKPYFQYFGLAEGLALGAYVKIGSVSGGYLAADSDIAITPGITASYSF